VLILLHWMPSFFSMYWEVIFTSSIVLLNCLLSEKSLIRWSTNPLKYSLHISVCCCFVPGRCSSLGIYFIIGCLTGIIWLVVTCEGGNLSLSHYPFASSKPQVTRDVSPRPHLPKQKEPSHRGDSGWDWFSYASLTSFHQSIILTTNCAITGSLE